ncbi:class I SAM-dependent methyltransferase [Haloferula sargassicola]|uniref:SAM-dependent methyltransferase n=1 Tax=Haloferula sargassicola TaxID=490096 RepID=A0ABP9UTU0_9BACT
MDLALYHPEGGYYATPGRRVGRHGDFYTSVSAGPLFGKILALHLAPVLSGMDGPLRILELGAHDGSLARDVLEALATDAPQLIDRLEYAIIEPLEALALRQRERLAGLPARIVADPSQLEPRAGVLVANELIDALSCHLVESTGDGWQEIGVGLASDRFTWKPLGNADPELVRHLPARPAGYRTEVRPFLAEFLRPLRPLVSPGRLLFFDYGFERAEYLDPARAEGTLRTYCEHRSGDDPLDAPGTRDITAHVEFTSLREALESLGGEVVRFENQSRFLTAAARPWLLGLEGRTDAATAKLLRNFQTLTHPGHLGSRFHVMEARFGP